MDDYFVISGKVNLSNNIYIPFNCLCLDCYGIGMISMWDIYGGISPSWHHVCKSCHGYGIIKGKKPEFNLMIEYNEKVVGHLNLYNIGLFLLGKEIKEQIGLGKFIKTEHIEYHL